MAGLSLGLNKDKKGRLHNSSSKINPIQQILISAVLFSLDFVSVMGQFNQPTDSGLQHSQPAAHWGMDRGRYLFVTAYSYATNYHDAVTCATFLPYPFVLINLRCL
jgi:hypothetical protein